jgi:hypothetical protein
MKKLTKLQRSVLITVFVSLTSCSSQQKTPLSLGLSPGFQPTPKGIPQRPPECPEKARVKYEQLADIFNKKKEKGLSNLDQQIRSTLGRPNYEDRSQKDGIITYEWLSPDCPGWYIHASFATDDSYHHIYTREIPPTVATFPDQDAKSPSDYCKSRWTNSLLAASRWQTFTVN